MNKHHTYLQPATAPLLLLWCLLLICTYNPATAQHVVRTKDGKPLLNVKKGMYGADFKAPVLHITPPPKFLDSLINVKVGDTFGTAPTEYGLKVGHLSPSNIDLKKHGKVKKVNDSLYVFKIHLIFDKAKEANINFAHRSLGDKNEILVGDAAKPQKTQMYIYDSKGSFLAGPVNRTERIGAITSNEYIIEIKLSSKENYDKMNLVINAITFVYLNSPKPLNEKKNAIQENVGCFSLQKIQLPRVLTRG